MQENGRLLYHKVISAKLHFNSLKIMHSSNREGRANYALLKKGGKGKLCTPQKGREGT